MKAAANLKARDSMMSEENVSQVLLERVMNKLSGRGSRTSNPDKGEPRKTEEQKKNDEDIRRLELFGREMTGIGRSIEALIALYNRKLDEELGSEVCLIKQDPMLYRGHFTANTDRIQELIDVEIE